MRRVLILFNCTAEMVTGLILALCVLSKLAVADSVTNVQPRVPEEKSQTLHELQLQIAARMQGLPPSNLVVRIGELADEGFVTVDGHAQRRAAIASRDIVSFGASALPSLIGAVADRRPEVRKRALDLICQIAGRLRVTEEMLPVFRATVSDENADIRAKATAGIGEVCIQLMVKSALDKSPDLMELLVARLEDRERRVQLTAAMFLVECGREDLLKATLREALKEEGWVRRKF